MGARLADPEGDLWEGPEGDQSAGRRGAQSESTGLRKRLRVSRTKTTALRKMSQALDQR